MRDFLIGVALGAVAAYLFQKSREEGGLEKMCDEMKGYSDKVKRNVKNTWDKGVNEAEYIKDRVEDKVEAVQAKVKKAVE